MCSSDLKVGTHLVTDDFGNSREASGLGLKDEDITIEHDEVAQTILIRVDYDREVVLEPSKKIFRLHFHPQLAGPLNVRR